MPIYEYRCKNCGNEFEILQKISDKPLTECEKCGKNGLEKIVSSTQFQLKGSGWYVTDFKNKPLAKKDKPVTQSKEGESAKKPVEKSSSSDSK